MGGAARPVRPASLPRLTRPPRSTERDTVTTNEADKAQSHSTSESENPAIPSPTPVMHRRPQSNRDWWPNQVDLSVLNRPSKDSDPLGEDFDYKAEFAKLDVEELKRDPRSGERRGGKEGRCRWWPYHYTET